MSYWTLSEPKQTYVCCSMKMFICKCIICTMDCMTSISAKCTLWWENEGTEWVQTIYQGWFHCSRYLVHSGGSRSLCCRPGHHPECPKHGASLRWTSAVSGWRSFQHESLLQMLKPTWYTMNDMLKHCSVYSAFITRHKLTPSEDISNWFSVVFNVLETLVK